ncbi:outer membrane lipoprotein carrier protein LolA [Desulfovibrio litoralis]|uniref:Outer membrane lipoprotein-sorting protein n=1 Tax=Desulfovibrio litoralis DSM 11393 TaxID=1121455 RepID=A0A1M7STW4_9BACT|nr:outer membrane lipoprotein carrier protein LolA [Desulfovibrio litoralis]SHN61840.1 Outer membrane lipoprotein-sorting protein [Desulfovibrio litoralis DSM 11393]
MRSFLILLCLLFFSPFSCYAGSPLEQAELTKLLKAHSPQVQSFSCDFTQTTSVPLLENAIVSKGHLFFLAPNSIKWEYTFPFKEGFVLHNGIINRWTEDKPTPQSSVASKDVLGSFLGEQFIMWVQFDVSRILADYSVILISEKPLTLELVPTNPQIGEVVKSLTISFVLNGLASNVLLKEKNGGETRLEFFNHELNNSLVNKVFQ